MELFKELLAWLHLNYISAIWSCAVLLLYLITARQVFPIIDTKVDEGGFKDGALKRAYHTVRLLAGTLAIGILLIIWGVDISGLLLISTSLLTLLGVALFASWSLLSNITSYFVILFHSAYKRGNFVRVLDGDNYVEGYISELSLFNIKLITNDREIIVYPNNLILNRPTIINPRIHLDSVGKIAVKASNINLLGDDKS